MLVVSVCLVSRFSLLRSFLCVVILLLVNVSSYLSATDAFFNSRIIRCSVVLPELDAPIRTSPNMGRLLLLLMTLDNADNFAESAVLDTVNLIIYKNIKFDRR